jgi:hypothetical protein
VIKSVYKGTQRRVGASNSFDRRSRTMYHLLCVLVLIQVILGWSFAPSAGQGLARAPVRSVIVGRSTFCHSPLKAAALSVTPATESPIFPILTLLGDMGKTIAAVSAFVLSFCVKKANAADAIKGWDLYGRVPHDDWLFSSWRLTNPRILRSSLTESITNELSTVLYAYRRRKRVMELSTTFGGLAVVGVSVLLVGFLYKSASFANSRNAKRRALGSVSAVSKKGQKKGRDIDEMGSGWVDMDDEDLD